MSMRRKNFDECEEEDADYEILFLDFWVVCDAKPPPLLSVPYNSDFSIMDCGVPSVLKEGLSGSSIWPWGKQGGGG